MPRGLFQAYSPIYVQSLPQGLYIYIRRKQRVRAVRARLLL